MAKDISKELKKLENAWENTAPREQGEFEEFEDGDYAMTLEDMELNFSKGAGKLQVVSKMKFIDGPYEGKEKWRFDTLETDTNIAFFKTYCETIGLDCPSDITDLPDAIKSFKDEFEGVINITLKTKGDFQNVYVKGVTEPKSDKKDKKGSKKEEPEEVTADEIDDMSRKEVKSLIKERDLDVDPSDFDDDDELKEAVKKELGLTKKKNKK